MPDQELEKLRKLSFCHSANIVLVHDVTDQYRRGTESGLGGVKTNFLKEAISEPSLKREVEMTR